jgi:hypothetical protein
MHRFPAPTWDISNRSKFLAERLEFSGKSFTDRLAGNAYSQAAFGCGSDGKRATIILAPSFLA